jgi:hypothetical protein
MNGQWIGTYAGTNQGVLVIDLDDVGDHYEGSAAALDVDLNLPPILAALMDIPKGETDFRRRVQLLPIDRQTGSVSSWEELKKHYPPDVRAPAFADTEWKVRDAKTELSWKTDIETWANGIVERSRAGEPSELNPLPDVKTWEDFRRFARSLKPYRYIFRGQPNNRWRLRTSFHRSGRASLMRFVAQDIPTLHRQLGGMMTHHLDLRDPLHNAAFYSLIQHHGYPTPLLDWTYSPFIGAFFAYRGIRPGRAEPDEWLRIFVFDKLHWSQDFKTVAFVTPPKLNFTVLEPLALNNPRVVPQQSVSSVTNIDDIETYLIRREADRQKNYLLAVDLPAMERDNVMHELNLMGITAGSLFPGLEGACEQIRERYFNF